MPQSDAGGLRVTRMNAHTYPGTELELFQHAVHWKQYYANRLAPYISGDVLEVGAGIGGTTAHLCSGTQRSWTCLEPDAALLEAARARFNGGSVKGVPLRWQIGTLNDLPSTARFNTILYIDVLEHIEHDRDELKAARSHLADGGHIVVLSPAHQWLYSEFDRAVGHHRRYTAAALRALTPSGARLVHSEYLDSFGTLLSATNRLFLRQSRPTSAQIAFWDRWLLPVSKVTDRMLGSVIGRSVVAVWQRE